MLCGGLGGLKHLTETPLELGILDVHFIWCLWSKYRLSPHPHPHLNLLKKWLLNYPKEYIKEKTESYTTAILQEATGLAHQNLKQHLAQSRCSNTCWMGDWSFNAFKENPLHTRKPKHLSNELQWAKGTLLWSKCLRPQNSCQNPNPRSDGIRRYSLWGWLGHEGGALVDGISALMKVTPHGSLAHFLPR